ncbi:MAG: hypothetical protein EU541_02440, partial [Promethearchaeota archaeon]
MEPSCLYPWKSMEINVDLNHDAKISNDEDNEKELKDMKKEFYKYLDLIQQEKTHFEDLINFFEKHDYDKATKGLINELVPIIFYDTVNDYYDKEYIELKRRYQKGLFIFIVSLLVNREFLKTFKKKVVYYNEYGLRSDGDYEKVFKKILENLIFDGIQQNNLKKWYKDLPKTFSRNRISKEIDPLIIKQVYFPFQSKRVPEHLKQ